MTVEEELTCNICGSKLRARKVRLFGQWDEVPECPRCHSLRE